MVPCGGVRVFLCDFMNRPSPRQSVLVTGRGRGDEVLTNAFSFRIQMAIWFSSFDLLM